MSPQKVYEYYAQAKRRIIDILESIDSKKRLKLDHVWKKIERTIRELAERSMLVYDVKGF